DLDVEGIDLRYSQDVRGVGAAIFARRHRPLYNHARDGAAHGLFGHEAPALRVLEPRDALVLGRGLALLARGAGIGLSFLDLVARQVLADLFVALPNRFEI